MTTHINTTKSRKLLAAIALGLTLLGVGAEGASALEAGRVRLSTSSGVTEPAAMLDAGRVRLSTSSGVKV